MKGIPDMCTEEELERAQCFLKTNAIGQRYQAAEFALTLLLENKLPRLRQFILNAAFDLREISDTERFAELAADHGDLNELIQGSEPGGYVKVTMCEERIRFVLFYEPNLGKSQATLYSRCLGEIVAVTYAALGLDMSGIISIDEKMVTK